MLKMGKLAGSFQASDGSFFGLLFVVGCEW